MTVLLRGRKNHSDRNLEVMPLLGLNPVIRIIPKRLHTLGTQYYCMKIIEQSVKFLNLGHAPNQPVYALTIEIRWRFPKEVGPNSDFILLDGLHFEQCMVVIHEQSIKRSGLYEILKNNDPSVIGTGAVANAKQTELMPLNWLTKIASSQMSNYWYFILTLQMGFLLYIRSIRE